MIEKAKLVDGNIANSAKIYVLDAAVFHSDSQDAARGDIDRIAAATVSTRVVRIISIAAIVSIVAVIVADRWPAAKACCAGDPNTERAAADRTVSSVQNDRLPFRNIERCRFASRTAAVALDAITAC